MRTLLKLPEKAYQGFRKFNAWLVPPQQYMSKIMLGLSALEEIYFIAKTAVDGTVDISEKVLYQDNYHQERIREYKGQKRMVVFVPGYMQTPKSFFQLEHYLGIELFDAFTYVWGDFPYSQDITLSAEQLNAVLCNLLKKTGVQEIFLVGHSQGGIIIRALVQHGMSPELPIKKCLSLSSPHQGTWAGLVAVPHRGARKVANLIPYIRKVQGESGLQLLPGSQFLRELNSRPLPDNIRFASIYYAWDPMIWPTTNAIIPYPEAENHFINKIGHAQPLFCPRAAQIAIRFLYGEKKKTLTNQNS